MEKCPLCQSFQLVHHVWPGKKSQLYKMPNELFHCLNCDLHFKNSAHFLSSIDELKRYDTHVSGNDGHLQFLNQMLDASQLQLPAEFLKRDLQILDFGCGKNPHLAHEITKRGFMDVEFWDPFYFPEKKWSVEKKFDLIFVCEVAEHFNHPLTAWLEINQLLKKQARVVVKSMLITDGLDLQFWWYKNDPTHVVFYSPKNFEYLAQMFEWDVEYCDQKSLTILKKR